LNFDLTHEQNLLRQTVREFANREIAPQASDLDEAERFSPELTRRMGEVELFGMLVSKEYGGSDIGHVAYCIAIEEIARVDASQAATVAVGNSVGIGPIYNFGTLEQKSRWLPELCKGHKLAAFGLTEPNAGSDAGATKTRAELRGDRWIINGNL